jgi:hypothetical protein
VLLPPLLIKLRYIRDFTTFPSGCEHGFRSLASGISRSRGAPRD